MLKIEFLRAHLPAIIFSVIFGTLVAGQFFVAVDRISGVFPELADDQSFYLSRIQDFRDGATMSGNTYLLEQKTAPPMNYLTGEGVEAFILNALNVPTQEALLLFPLLLTPIIFFLTYAIFVALRSPRFFALAGTSLLLFSMLQVFVRPISPQFNFIFWLLAIWGLIQMTNRPTWKSILLESIAVGFLFYLYPYYWTHILATLGVLFIAYLFINRKSAWSFFFIIVASLSVGGGALLLLWENRLNPFYAESMQRLGFIATHFPSGLTLTLVAGGVFLVSIFLARKGLYDWRFLATGALTVGGVIAMNQHVITGLNMEFSSHYTLQILFSSAFLFTAALSVGGWWRMFEGKWVRVALGILVFIFLIVSVKSVYASVDQLSKNENLYREYTLLTDWFKKNAEDGSVVYASDLVSNIIPAYTKENVFYTRNANVGFISQNEVVDRFIIQYFHSEINKSFIEAHERALFGHGYINSYNHGLSRQKFLSYFGVNTPPPVHIPDTVIEKVMLRAKELQSETFAAATRYYEIDYVVVDAEEKDQLTMADTPQAQLVFETPRFKVYKNNL